MRNNILPLVFRESSSRGGFLLFRSRFISSFIAPLPHPHFFPSSLPPIRTKALDKPLAQPQVVSFERKSLMSRLQLIGDTCLREFPKNWAQTSLPQVLGKLLLLHCGWLHEADFALNISDKWLESKRRLSFTQVISKGKKKFFTIHAKTKSVFPVEGRNIGSDFSEIRQHASLQRNRENQVVCPRSRKTDDTVL